MDLLSNIVWAGLVLYIFWKSKDVLFTLVSRIESVELGPLKLLIEKVKMTEKLSFEDTRKLEMFRGEDIWVLQNIDKKEYSDNPAYRFQLLRVVNMGLAQKNNDTIELTSLGMTLLNEIKKLEV